MAKGEKGNTSASGSSQQQRNLLTFLRPRVSFGPQETPQHQQYDPASTDPPSDKRPALINQTTSTSTTVSKDDVAATETTFPSRRAQSKLSKNARTIPYDDSNASDPTYLLTERIKHWKESKHDVNRKIKERIEKRRFMGLGATAEVVSNTTAAQTLPKYLRTLPYTQQTTPVDDDELILTETGESYTYECQRHDQSEDIVNDLYRTCAISISERTRPPVMLIINRFPKWMLRTPTDRYKAIDYYIESDEEWEELAGEDIFSDRGDEEEEESEKEEFDDFYVPDGQFQDGERDDLVKTSGDNIPQAGVLLQLHAGPKHFEAIRMSNTDDIANNNDHIIDYVGNTEERPQDASDENTTTDIKEVIKQVFSKGKVYCLISIEELGEEVRKKDRSVEEREKEKERKREEKLKEQKEKERKKEETLKERLEKEKEKEESKLKKQQELKEKEEKRLQEKKEKELANQERERQREENRKREEEKKVELQKKKEEESQRRKEESERKEREKEERRKLKEDEDEKKRMAVEFKNNEKNAKAFENMPIAALIAYRTRPKRSCRISTSSNNTLN